jgi:phosphoribosylaminoimidazole-succinocarboxamide synthase
VVEANVILRTDIPGFPVRRGKVRDIYDLGDKLLIVAASVHSTW